jgi:GNAT superfamily N-acetyltransferase
MTELPAGLTARPCRPADAPAVFAVFAAAEQHDTGEVSVELEDIEGDWQRPSLSLERDSVAVLEGDVMVAAAEVYKGRRAEATVHPDHRGRGIGTWLVGWAREASARNGGTVVGQTVPAGGEAEGFFRELGYERGWTSWVLEVPEGAAIEPQPLPDGYELRDFVPGEDDEVTYRLVEDAFNEWPGRQASSFDDWAANTLRRPGFEPWQIRLATDPTGTPVGTAFVISAADVGYVDQLAVRSDQRGRGLARALLADAFERARAHGAVRSELSTDSRTGALGLYETVGMVVTKTYHHWQTTL